MNSRFSHYLKHIDIWSLSRMHLFIEVSEVLLIMTLLGCCLASSDFMELQFRVLSVLRQPCHSYTTDMALKLWSEICCDVPFLMNYQKKLSDEWQLTWLCIITISDWIGCSSGGCAAGRARILNPCQILVQSICVLCLPKISAESALQ